MKWLFLVCIATVTLLFFFQPVENKKSSLYYRHFKGNKQLLAKRFQSKIQQSPPPWMLRQIEQDLSPFVQNKLSLQSLNATHKITSKSEKAVLRYRIVNNQLYVDKLLPFEPCERFQNALLTLCQLASLPNLDFLVTHEDGTKEPFYLTPSNQAPLFGWAKLMTTPDLILIPDYRSVSTLWFDDLRKLIEGKEFKGTHRVWSEKINKAFWRGGLTESINRPLLCHLSQQYPDHIDAALTGPSFQQTATYEEHLPYKYLPVLDGIMCSYPGYQWRLLSGCLTLKPDSEQIQWFYQELKPYVHFLPVASDLSDLLLQIQWAVNHDTICEQIALQAKEFALTHLQFDDIYHYLYLALTQYALCLDQDVQNDLKKTSYNPYWIRIKN